ncbi:P-loop containing nucleoside triphosphate hydrolase protein [Rhizoclosmatium globosum]|uniref:p-loop containing nucleoside triphosphate hydrolase protein n=1 Tax=Rhizoclosmatium globosum TaxID=329046 RepID=A0A1Y2BQG6_9FUNG|nr:P-loop containing nucleoside triphosphate hydrolase protein [Rhizoclosmatium globosum]|eukprot:ORY36994.1 P-loop containing nucleoside triphosphate hydrolase protein [Rhizoclosmatium globosum]
MKIRAVVAPISGKRVNLTTEVLSGVLNEIRKSEIALVLRRSILMAFVMTQGFAIPILCSCITFIIYGFLNDLNVASIFSAMSWFNQLPSSSPLKLNKKLLWMRRQTRCCSSKEGQKRSGPGPPGGKPPGAAAGGPPKKPSAEDAKAIAPQSQISSLKNINLNIEKGSLVAIVGAVGSGKSSLLQALIGEMKTTQGKITFSGSLGYAAQSAWIQNANLRENIVFGKEFNKEKYLNALLDAALLPDLKVLPDGDQTSIGERGINLSEIVLIDDPLSAVDAHVGKHLFERCIRGALGHRTRILVTHQLHFLPQCDKIIVMKDGEIAEQGAYNELIANVLESKKTGKDIMTVEDQETGKVAARVWLNYVKASGGTWGFLLSELEMIVAHLVDERKLWTNKYQYIWGYIAFALLMTAGTFAYALFFAYSGTRASKNLHEKALERILRAPTSFYDTTPLGRILNRFSRDLSFSFRQLISQIGICLSTFIVMCTALPWFTIPCIPAIALYYYIAAVYRTTARELKRLDSTTKSPLYTNLGETLTAKNDRVSDDNNSPYYLLLTAANWLSLRLQLIGALLVLCAALIGVLTDTISPSLFGLTLSYSLSVTQILSMTIQNFTQCEIAMNSLNADAIIEGNRPEKEWPHKGTIEFKDVVMRYAPTLPIVLNHVSFEVRDRQKIGIVGRTGSGKSSLMQALFRMVEPASGQIIIDGKDISLMGLSDLRSRIAIIPQDPVVFSGSFRSNMDPFSEHSDSDSGLKAKVSKSDGQLDAAVDAGGENLSVGERQLLCLSRAMLKTPRILIMDEATANVDYETDAMIQKALREDFKDATVLTIAHRLNTVIDYDRVMVLEKGSIAEFDSPKKLLDDESSMFFALVAQTGESNAAMLKELANQ